MSAETSLFERARTEIVDLHAFFVTWFTGKATEADFLLSMKGLDPAFHMITPDGGLHARQTIVDRLRAARGSAEADFTIAIEAVEPFWQTEAAILVTYIEAQVLRGRPNRRRSSALFQKNSAAPNGIVWRHLHETWIDRPV